MSISSSDTDSDSVIENYIMYCILVDHDEQVRQEHSNPTSGVWEVRQERRLLYRQPQHTSRPGMSWVAELLHGHPMRMYESMRMYPETFCQFIDVIKQHNLLPPDGRGTCVPVMESVAIFLTVVACNDGQHSASECFHLSLETINQHVKRVATAICQLAPIYICPKDMARVHPTILHCSRFWPWFKDCVGAIDGIHIQAEISSEKQQAYRNRKGVISQNVLCACDFDMRFTFVVAGWEGSAHDNEILEDAIVNPTAKFPFPPGDKYYVVDASLRNTKDFLAPYRGQRYHLKDYRGSDREPKNAKELFNYRHSSLRNVIEKTFGAWKSRFGILRQGMNNYDFDTQVKIVMACAVLHNFLRELQSGDVIFTEYENDEMVADNFGNLSTQGNNVATFSQSPDPKMHREDIALRMWEEYIKE